MNRKHTLTAAIAVVAAVAATVGFTTAQADNAPQPTVDTTNGPVRGTESSTVRTYQGIPYAQAPVDDRRFEPPAPAKPWSEPLDATKPGKPCTQPTDQPIGIPGGREDCLSLNVTTPANDHKKRPVVVWIHGGSFTYGDGASYGAEKLAAKGDQVVVSFNYRLGTFGFLAHPELDNADNLGFQDQQAVLKWVRSNASAFGGDPGNVSIMGESGGGYSVCGHLASPSSAGLFDKAIIHSAGCVGSKDSSFTRSEAEKNTLAMMKRLKCDDIECLRNKDSKEILEASEGGHAGYRLFTGTKILPKSPSEAISSGNFNRVPVLHGSNHDEENNQIAGMELQTGKPLTKAGYVKQLRENFGADADAVMAEYPVDDYETPSNALGAALTDAKWSTPAYDTQNALSKHVSTYAFEVAEPNAPWFAGMDRPSFTLGTSHMQELAYFFENKLFEKRDAEQERLSDELVDYWSSFARNANPNQTDQPKWKEFSPDRPYTQQLVADMDDIGDTDFAEDHKYEFWKSLGR